MSETIIDEIFERYFGSLGSGVRNEQRAVIKSVLAGKRTLSIMPTGGGKSLCYWIAGLALGGTTLAIFPLTALMDEQAQKLREHGLNVAVLHSGIPTHQQYRQLIDLYSGQWPDFVFTSPERLATDGFFEFVLQQRREQIKLVVVDEIHCISQWGYDFRPFYREIPPFLDTVFGGPAQWPIILGLTATLSTKNTEQICNDFNIESQHVLKSQYMLRYPIHIAVVKTADDPEKDELVWAKLGQHQDEKVLVYIENRDNGPRSSEGMARRAQNEGFAADFFHAGMTGEAKAAVIQRFKDGEIRTVFATSAFGMGIDIPDIRGVIHYRPPESVEQFYQQIGRAGRDGRPAWSLLYFSDKNVAYHKTQFINKSFPTSAQIENAFETMTAGPGTIKSFSFFSEEESQPAFPYLLRTGAIQVRCKGMVKIDIFEKVGGEILPEFDAVQQSTRTGLTTLTAQRTGKTVEKLMEDIYRWLAQRRIKTDNAPAKCLIIEQLVDELPPDMVQTILADVAEKKQHRYSQLDEFVALLNGFSNSINFHQEIGRYLGVDEFQLKRIHQTLSGEMVRSKSEVIIANQLTQHRIPFSYEERLEAGGYGFAPDFTIRIGNTTYYWEHLGMLDLEQYRANWSIKQQWYDMYFPGQLITTEESSTLSQSTELLIEQRLLPLLAT